MRSTFVRSGAVLAAYLLPLIALANDAPAEVVRLRAVLDVPQIGAPAIAADGSSVAFTETTADWERNSYVTRLYVAPRGKAAKLAFADGANGDFKPRWSPDGRSIAFLANLAGTRQVHVVDAQGGEPRALTAWPDNLIDFAWSTDGHHIAVLAAEPPPPAWLARRDDYGSFTVAGEIKPQAHLWLLDVEKSLQAGGAKRDDTRSVRRLTGGDGERYSIVAFAERPYRSTFSFSPDGRYIAFGHARSLDILDAVSADIAVVEVATGKVRRLTAGADWDELPVFSPDSRTVLFQRTSLPDFVADKILIAVAVDGGAERPLQLRFPPGTTDHQPLLIDWTSAGIDVFVHDRTRQQIYRINPATGTAAPLATVPGTVTAAALSADGKHLAFVAADSTTAPEVYRMTSGNRSAQRLSFASQAMSDWPCQHHEVIEWTASDGVVVQGILYGACSLAADARTPLIVLLHGGPRDMEFPRRLHDEHYPVDEWLALGARVLVPNYRGSLGYGAAFRKLTWGRTGIAETADILSGVEHLAKRGLIDRERVGVAGHSWGGYLSAFVATSTDTFRAASVGAGITDNRINYVLALGAVAREGYLQSTPWENPQLWAATSPVTYIARAKTPTLIQHGVADPVVPVANAHELHRGLADMGVPVRLVLYENQGHNISTPKECLAWLLENRSWFARHLWSEEAGLPWEARAP